MAARKLENQRSETKKQGKQNTGCKNSTASGGKQMTKGTRTAGTQKKRTSSGLKGATGGGKKATAGNQKPTAEDMNTYRDQMAFETGVSVLVAALIALFFYICFFGLCGKPGTVISGISFGFFGWLSWLLPAGAVFAYLFALANPGDRRVPRKLISGASFFILFSALKELIFPREILTEYFTSNHVLHKNYFHCLFLSFKEVASHGRGSGGILGRAIGDGISSVIGKAGAGILLFGICILAAYFFCGPELFASLRKKNAYRRKMAEAYDEFVEQEEDYVEPSYQLAGRQKRPEVVRSKSHGDLQTINLKTAAERMDEAEARQKEAAKRKKEEAAAMKKLTAQKKKEMAQAEKDWEAMKPENRPESEEIQLLPDGMQEIKGNLDSEQNQDGRLPLVTLQAEEAAGVSPEKKMSGVKAVQITRGMNQTAKDPALEPQREESAVLPEIPEEQLPRIPIYREEMEQKFGSAKSAGSTVGSSVEESVGLPVPESAAPMASFAPKDEVTDIRPRSQIQKEAQGLSTQAVDLQQGNRAKQAVREGQPAQGSRAVGINSEVTEKHSAQGGQTSGNQPVQGNQMAGKNQTAMEKATAETKEVPKAPYQFPPIELLGRGGASTGQVSDARLRQTAVRLKETLDSFNVEVEMGPVTCGPTVTRYEVLPAQGVRVNKITNLADDLKLSMAVQNIRIEAPIPGKAAVGIEVPNEHPSAVPFRDLLEGSGFHKEKSPVTFAVGKDIAGKVILTDIAKMPHLLIAGATGSGKSVCINTLIMSILYKSDPNEVKLIMIDPKVVELSVYNGIPHLFCPVVTDPKEAAASLNWAVREMMDRYNKFKELGVRNISGYNAKIKTVEHPEEAGYEPMPLLVIIVDEFADLMMVASKEVEDAVCRLAQLARAAGIHLILATQRPSVNVITGVIKANIPSRIAFSVSSAIDSRTILDKAGAEKLLGKGDMLFFPSGYSEPVRLQGAFVSDKEVSDVVDYIKEHNATPIYNESVTEVRDMPDESGQPGASEDKKSDVDEYFEEAGRFVIESERAAAGQLQRRFSIGFNRAGRIIDQLNRAGVVGPAVGTKPREVLMTIEQFEACLNGNEAAPEEVAPAQEVMES